MKDNILRGKILDILRKMYPEGADKRTINSILYQYHTIDNIAASLEYLVDKQYALRKEFPHPYAEQEVIQWYKLLPKGIDLLDGNIDADPGILIPRG